MQPIITLTDAYDKDACKAINDQLSQFNSARTEITDYRPLAITVANPDTGETLGGLLGYTLWSVLYISHLILPDSMRNIGLGRRLLVQAEEEAIRRGCHSAWLDTFSFQAPGFYEKLGYIVFGTIDDYPPGHSRFFLKKRLVKSEAANCLRTLL